MGPSQFCPKRRKPLGLPGPKNRACHEGVTSLKLYFSPLSPRLRREALGGGISQQEEKEEEEDLCMHDEVPMEGESPTPKETATFS